MRVEVEIVLGESLGGFVAGVVVEEDRAEDGALGIDARGQSAVQLVV
jgi:hypothetical protein